MVWSFHKGGNGVNQSHSLTSNFAIGTSNLLFGLFACLLWQYFLLRIRLKTEDRKEAVIWPETYALPIAPLTVHKSGQPRSGLRLWIYFGLIFKLKGTYNSSETQERVPTLENRGCLWLKVKAIENHVLLMSQLSCNIMKAKIFYRVQRH